MSRHVKAHRWIDIDAGVATSSQIARAEAHAAECDRCARGRERVLAARAAMREIARDEPDDMRWDEIGAQIYWTTAAERRARGRRGIAWRPIAVAAVAAAAVAAGVVALVALRDGGPARVAERGPVEPAPAEAPAPAPEPEAAPMYGVVTLAQGDVRIDGEPLDFDRIVAAGQTITTGDGRLVVQFDRDSTFALAPNSALELASFDERRVQLDVRGTVDVRVSERPVDQRFAVGAGARDVVVRGTVFRVAHDANELEVVCTRGRVSVIEGDIATEVRAGERLTVLDVLARSPAARPIPERELAQLDAALEVPVLPLWDGARGAIDTTARLAVDAPPARAVEIDGIAVGEGSLAVRVAPGRHHVEGAGTRGTWLGVEAGAEAHASLVRRARPRKTVRAPQLDAALRVRSHRLERCARPLAVAGISEGSFVTLELGVNTDGSQGFLNIVDSNVPDDVARCVRGVVDGIALPRGPRETLRKTIPFE